MFSGCAAAVTEPVQTSSCSSSIHADSIEGPTFTDGLNILRQLAEDEEVARKLLVLLFLPDRAAARQQHL